jgi:hypothetical protein
MEEEEQEEGERKRGSKRMMKREEKKKEEEGEDKAAVVAAVISSGSSNSSSSSSSNVLGESVNLYLSTRPEVKVTSDKEMELIWAGPAVLHTERAVIRVQFTLVLLTAAHLIQRELLHTFLAIVAIQEDLYQLVHCCAV